MTRHLREELQTLAPCIDTKLKSKQARLLCNRRGQADAQTVCIWRDARFGKRTLDLLSCSTKPSTMYSISMRTCFRSDPPFQSKRVASISYTREAIIDLASGDIFEVAASSANDETPATSNDCITA